MIDRKYFEDVLPDQLRLMERQARLTLHLTTGEDYVVQSLVAAHPTYVVVQVYGKKDKAPRHTKQWRDANPTVDAAIYDQLCIPYQSIALAHLTARAIKGDYSQVLVGFRQI
jgi:hypothetical protein